ncbi:fluoride efflux transporter CrcB [Marinovum sp. 2_MG-2023]|uniref:fluoride efflux transporter CrcB n=1 Tax=unclassified Marinovum TaxID=2647166 RepID=UPI0026E3C561|nr:MULTISPECIES: fluoride efflux transporter CrcB [unclassified Marinovum]MDO6728495.1 fluoride efflux transporter CrcB [Marinovum sp. 2_MG-2023]MDO6778089.1 fluoride efflux transporter CrcB [Marinovum sp. 1_MG-2023]
MTTTLMQVALGGAFGASARYLTGLAVVRLMGHGFPWGTFAVNVLGSFLMGVLVVVLSQYHATRFAPLVITGFLGGFTTFSAFSLDTVALFERGQMTAAAFYVLASVGLAIAALFAGMMAAKGYFA